MKRLAKKNCLKAIRLFAVMIATVPKRERKLPVLALKKKKKERKNKTPHLYYMIYAQLCIYPLLFVFWERMLIESMLLIS